MVFQALAALKFREKLGVLSFVFDIYAFLYFQFVKIAFLFFNRFVPKEVVPEPRDPLLLLSATKAAELIRKRQLTSTDLVNAYIKRIQEVNPIINAVVYPHYEEALEKAKKIDVEISEMGDVELDELQYRKPLFGLPFTLKDSMTVKGKICTCGTYARKEIISTETAEVVQRVINAGAILLAQTNVPQACYWIETNNGVFGRTNNPYDSRRNAGGSSGGEGALNGASASLFGIGSDIGGSIRVPSFCNGIFGFLPSSGAVPNEGHIPIAPKHTYKYAMNRIGPLTRFAEDLNMLSNILSSSDIRVPQSCQDIRVFYAKGLIHAKLMEPYSSETLDALQKVVRHFESKFGKKVQLIDIEETADALEIFTASFKESSDEPLVVNMMDDPLEAKGSYINCWTELLKYFCGTSHHSLAMILTALGDKRKIFEDDERNQILAKRDRLRQGLIDLLGKNGVLLWPGYTTPAPFHNELLLKPTTLAHTAFWNTLLLPIVQCPTGLTADKLPNGVMVIGSPDSEGTLIAVAKEISESFGGWTPPGRH